MGGREETVRRQFGRAGCRGLCQQPVLPVARQCCMVQALLGLPERPVALFVSVRFRVAQSDNGFHPLRSVGEPLPHGGALIVFKSG